MRILLCITSLLMMVLIVLAYINSDPIGCSLFFAILFLCILILAEVKEEGGDEE